MDSVNRSEANAANLDATLGCCVRDVAGVPVCTDNVDRATCERLGGNWSPAGTCDPATQECS